MRPFSQWRSWQATASVTSLREPISSGADTELEPVQFYVGKDYYDTRGRKLIMLSWVST